MNQLVKFTFARTPLRHFHPVLHFTACIGHASRKFTPEKMHQSIQITDNLLVGTPAMQVRSAVNEKKNALRARTCICY